jgi:hypothetical protein
MTRRNNLILLVAIIALGIGSRLLHTGWILFDKYLGDALYAAMVYALIGLIHNGATKTKMIGAMLLMTAIECFQLTSIPLWLHHSGSVLLKTIAVLLGLQFDWADLLAYAVGIGGMALAETLFTRQRQA